MNRNVVDKEERLSISLDVNLMIVVYALNENADGVHYVFDDEEKEAEYYRTKHWPHLYYKFESSAEYIRAHVQEIEQQNSLRWSAVKAELQHCTDPNKLHPCVYSRPVIKFDDDYRCDDSSKHHFVIDDDVPPVKLQSFPCDWQRTSVLKECAHEEESNLLYKQ